MTVWTSPEPSPAGTLAGLTLSFLPALEMWLDEDSTIGMAGLSWASCRERDASILPPGKEQPLGAWDAQSKHREATADAEDRGLCFGVHLFWVCRAFCGVSQGTCMEEFTSAWAPPALGPSPLRKPHGKCSCYPPSPEKKCRQAPTDGHRPGSLSGTGQGLN